MVNVLGWMVWMQHRSIDIRRAQMENSGFAVIDPNDGMIMRTVHRIDLIYWHPQWRLGLRKAFDGPLDINFGYGSSVEGAQAASIAQQEVLTKGSPDGRHMQSLE
jgi:hypothetical protein